MLKKQSKGSKTAAITRPVKNKYTNAEINRDNFSENQDISPSTRGSRGGFINGSVPQGGTIDTIPLEHLQNKNQDRCF